MRKSKWYYCLLGLVAFTAQIYGQNVFVNRKFQVEYGQPQINPILNQFGAQWSKSIVTATGEHITVAHTAIAGNGEDILLTKYDADGVLVFQADYNTGSTNNDYGLGVYEDPMTNDIYVCGTTDQGGSPASWRAVLLRFDQTGNLAASDVFGTSGNNFIATDLLLHPQNGRLYVALSAEGGGTGYDFMLSEHNANTLAALNSNIYDYNQLDDFAMGITVGASGDITLIGASQSSSVCWAYATAVFDFNTLSNTGSARSNLGGFGGDQPLAYKKDNNNCIYITGKTWDIVNNNFNIKTVKINANYTIAWTATLAIGTGDDVANSICLDNAGNILIGGYTTNSNNKKEMLLVKYNSTNGSIIWQKQLPANNPGYDAHLKDLVSNPANGKIYFTAAEKTANTSMVRTGRIHPAGGDILWEKYIDEASATLQPSDLAYTDDGIHVVSVRSASVDSYVLTSYSEFESDSARSFHGGKPSAMLRELIVSFNPTCLKKNVIDNTGSSAIWQYGTLEDFLTPTAFSALAEVLHDNGTELDIKVTKIFPDLKTTDTLSVSRSGQHVPIPAFWSNLVLHLPNTLSMQQAHNAFNGLRSIVTFDHPNYFTSVTSPNDSLYNNQLSLHPQPNQTVNDINVEEAWTVVPSGGKPFVRCGIFDTGIHWKHEDFGYDGTNPASSKVNGFQFLAVGAPGTGGPLKFYQFPDSGGHGTSCAGIIGAIRNNSKGISGIAGGDGAKGNPGISLYSLNTVDPKMRISDILIAIFYSSQDHTFTNNPYAFGLHCSNNSWHANLGNWSENEIHSLREQVHFAWRNQVTFVVSRGNGGTNDFLLPPCLDTSLVISVGGTGVTGGYKPITEFETGWAPSYGNGIDLSAPSVSTLIRTTGSVVKYGGFFGTSAAAPHVTGAVGLLMSYMNDTTGNNSYQNLAPEDCEFILTRSATDVETTGYDSLTGYGRLNIGKALRMVERPYRLFYHYGTNPLAPHSITKSVYSFNDTIHLLTPYKNPFNNAVYPKARYVVKTYKIDASVSHNITYPSDSLMYSWARHSSSYVFDLPDAQKRLTLQERVKINSCTGSGASLTGFVYEVWDTTGTRMGWWPCDTSFAALFTGLGAPQTLMEYSLVTKNKAVGLREFQKNLRLVECYPNPAKTENNITMENIGAYVTIELYDLQGRLIRTVYDDKISERKTTIKHNITDLPNSLYIYLIKSSHGTIARKFIKE